MFPFLSLPFGKCRKITVIHASPGLVQLSNKLTHSNSGVVKGTLPTTALALVCSLHITHYESLRNKEQINALKKVMKERVGELCSLDCGEQWARCDVRAVSAWQSSSACFCSFENAYLQAWHTKIHINTPLYETELRLKS